MKNPTFILVFVLSLTILACGGEKKKFLNQAKNDMCQMNELLNNPETKSDPAKMKEVSRLQKYIDAAQENSGVDKEDFFAELGELTKDCM